MPLKLINYEKQKKNNTTSLETVYVNSVPFLAAMDKIAEYP